MNAHGKQQQQQKKPGETRSTRNSPLAIFFLSLQGYLLILESQHLKKGLPSSGLARSLGHFLLFLCLFILWFLFSLTCFFFFSTLLSGEITFSGLNSHLIHFIFNQTLYPFLFAFYFQVPFLPFFSAFFLASSAGVSRTAGHTISHPGLGSWNSCLGCWEAGSALEVREAFSSDQVPSCFKSGNSFLSSPFPLGHL